MKARTILPGETLGVFGGGQLGRMFALAARRMGYRVHVFTPEHDSPAGQVADAVTNAPYDDDAAVARFAQAVRAATFEFENVPASVGTVSAAHTLVRPRGSVLEIAQDRRNEKRFLASRGFPVPRFAVVEREEDIDVALSLTGLPAVLKTATMGYDGKGQRVLRKPHEAHAAWIALGRKPCLLEAFVDFAFEVSVVAARDPKGNVRTFPVFENQHTGGILDVTVAPARTGDHTAAEAVDLAGSLLEELNVVGVLCVELFVTAGGRLLVNEIAPRPHNSGHLTLEATLTSQFEQQVRAVAGLPLGDTALLSPAAMANLLGDVWKGAEPRWERALKDPGVKLHLYGKGEARPGRKMGHLTALAPTPAEAERVVRAARGALRKAS